MPHYMIQWRYKNSAIKAMLTSPQDRSESVRPAVAAFKGKLLGFYFCYGEFDGMALLEMPSNEAVSAFIMTVMKADALDHIRTTVLLTPQESVQAMQMGHDVASGYKPPNA